MPERLTVTARRLIGAFRDVLRGATGTAAYDHYLAHCHHHHPGEPTLTRAAFFREQQSSRWEGVSRCC